GRQHGGFPCVYLYLTASIGKGTSEQIVCEGPVNLLPRLDQSEKPEIHPVFLGFPYFHSSQNLPLSALAD
ncbi:MAG: hypothetical protein ACI3V0_12385, partial [Faecousia sp.]